MADSSPHSRPQPPDQDGAEPNPASSESSPQDLSLFGRSKMALRVLERTLSNKSRVAKRGAQPDTTAATALDDGAETPERDIALGSSVERESPKRAAMHIGIGLVILGILLAGYVTWARRTHEIKTLVVQALPLALQGDAQSLRDAQAKLQKAVGMDDDNDRALGGLAEVHALLWVDHGFAAEKDAAKMNVEHARKAHAENAERYAAEGLVALGEGRAKDAETLLINVINQGAMSEKIHYVLGLAQRDLGKFKEGRDALRRAQEATSSAPHFAVALGDAYDAEGDANNAGLYWQMAVRANGSYVPGVARDVIRRIRRGEASAKLTQDVDRLQALPTELLGSHDIIAIAEARAALLYRDGDLNKALAAVQAAEKTAGESSHRLLLLKGQILLGQDQVDAGLAALGKAQALSHSTPRTMFALVDGYVRHQKFDQGLAQIAQAEKQLGASTHLDVARGDLYLAAKQYGKAASAYASAVKRDENSVLALVGRGVVARDQKQFDQAREWFEKAVIADNKAPQVYQAVGVMWIDMGALKEANTQLEMADQLYITQGADAVQRKQFYGEAVQHLSAARGGSAYAQQWKKKLAGL